MLALAGPFCGKRASSLIKNHRGASIHDEPSGRIEAATTVIDNCPEKDAFRWPLTGGSEPGEPTAR